MPVVAQVAGQIQEVKIAVGDSVKKGDLLVRIDSTVAEAQRAQAQAALELAQSQVELAKTQPQKTDLDAAQAAVSAGRAAYDRALQGATEEEKRMALAQLKQAEAAVAVYQGQYDRIAGNPYAAMMPESLQLQQATLSQGGSPGTVRQGAEGRDRRSDRRGLCRTDRRPIASWPAAGAAPSRPRSRPRRPGSSRPRLPSTWRSCSLTRPTSRRPPMVSSTPLDAVEGGMAGQGTALGGHLLPRREDRDPGGRVPFRGGVDGPAGRHPRGRLPGAQL